MGGKSAPRTPPAPDPTALANAQTQSNLATAREQQRLNMVNTTGPGGSVNYVADPNSPGGYRQVTTLAPGQQQAYDQGLSVYNQALQTAGGQIGRVNQALEGGLRPEVLPALQGFNPEDFNRQRFEDSAYQGLTRRLDPQFQQMERGLDARLAAQGLGANSEATRNIRQDFARDRADAYGQAGQQAIQMGGQEQSRAIQNYVTGGQFGNQARTQGLQEQAFIQNMPLQQLQALLGTGQVDTPQGVPYSPVGVGQTDVLGAHSLNQQAQWNRYNAQQRQQQAGLGGLFQLGSAAMTAFSDARLKENVSLIGRLANGLGVYAYNYVWSPVRTIGVMAQEVLNIKPKAVKVHPSGYLMVDYGAL